MRATCRQSERENPRVQTNLSDSRMEVCMKSGRTQGAEEVASTMRREYVYGVWEKKEGGGGGVLYLSEDSVTDARVINYWTSHQ